MKGVTILICTYNGYDRVRRALDCIAQQTVTNQFCYELLIIDNASMDSSFKLIKQYVDEIYTPFPFNVILEAKNGKINALLTGLSKAKYEYILVCDDDNYLTHDYLLKGSLILDKHPEIGALGGCGIPLFLNEPPIWFERYAHSFAIGPQNLVDGKLDFYPAELYGAGTFFRKNVLENYFKKGFNGIMSGRNGKSLVSGEDSEWCYLLQLAGYQVWYNSELRFQHLMLPSRMQWNYYVQLKEGIASGTAKLFSYRLFFLKKKPTYIFFLINYFFHFIKHLLVYCIFQIRKSVFPNYYDSETIDLGNVILKAKFFSFIVDFRSAVSHFKTLKKYFKLENK